MKYLFEKLVKESYQDIDSDPNISDDEKFFARLHCRSLAQRIKNKLCATFMEGSITITANYTVEDKK